MRSASHASKKLSPSLRSPGDELADSGPADDDDDRGASPGESFFTSTPGDAWMVSLVRGVRAELRPRSANVPLVRGVGACGSGAETVAARPRRGGLGQMRENLERRASPASVTVPFPGSAGKRSESRVAGDAPPPEGVGVETIVPIARDAGTVPGASTSPSRVSRRRTRRGKCGPPPRAAWRNCGSSFSRRGSRVASARMKFPNRTYRRRATVCDSAILPTFGHTVHPVISAAADYDGGDSKC